MIKALVLMAATLALAACNNPPSQDMAFCTVEARKVYPDLNTNDHSRSEAADTEYECMISKGYVWQDDKTKCPDIKDSHYSETTAECYRKPWPWE
jgi:hypothetical protein